ncbi:hypothetical protein AX14_009543 [Amanita brunnescens Koide BX004]|nr:hypothetical protein AX14_009543 [Amanita brunnescens Koide BX004]
MNSHMLCVVVDEVGQQHVGRIDWCQGGATLCEPVGAIVSVDSRVRGAVPKRKGGLTVSETVSDDFAYSNRGHLTGPYTGIEEGAEGSFVVNKENRIVDVLDASPLNRFFYGNNLGVKRRSGGTPAEKVLPTIVAKDCKRLGAASGFVPVCSVSVYDRPIRRVE